MNDMDMDMENEIQMDDGGDINSQMDDGEVNFDQEFDDNDDQISNWTSLENPTTNNPRATSPASKASSFGEEFASDNVFGMSGASPTTKVN